MGTSFPSISALGWGAGYGVGTPSSLWGDLCSQDILPSSYPLHVSVAPASSASLPLLPVSLWFLLHILSFRIYVHLVFKWFSATIILQFSCNCDMVMGGGDHSIYLLHHLDWKFPDTLLRFLQCS